MHCGQEICAQGFGGETEGNKPLGRPRFRWEHIIKIDLKETGIDGMEWVHLT
jgi:hypothetical protein